MKKRRFRVSEAAFAYEKVRKNRFAVRDEAVLFRML